MHDILVVFVHSIVTIASSSGFAAILLDRCSKL
jgi:hypothetical protein